MKLSAIILTFLICFSHCCKAKAQAYFLLPNATEMKTLYPAAKEITDGLERFQTPTTWVSGSFKILARVVDFRDGKAFFERNDGKVVGVEKSQLSAASQSEISSFESLLKARDDFVAKHKLQPQVVKLYADLKRAEENVKIQEQFIKDLRDRTAEPAVPAEPVKQVEPPARGEMDRHGRKNLFGRGRRPEKLDENRMGGVENRMGGVENVAPRTQLIANPITNTIYLMKDGSCSFRQDTLIPISLGNKLLAKEGNRLGVNDPKFSSDNEAVLVIRKDSKGRTNLIFRDAGKVRLTASVVAANSVTEIFNVVELELPRGTSPEDIVKSLGQPSSKSKHMVQWPDSKSIDNISYVPTINRKSIACEHWYFDDRPGLVVSIVNDGLYNVGISTD